MIYKKKHILKESLIIESMLIDDLSTFSVKEKKILRSLYKKYYKPNDPEFRWWRLNTFNITEELHEKWQLPFNVAYKMSKIFVLHGDELFKENHISYDIPTAEILKTYLSNFINNYRKSLNDDRVTPNWNLEVGDKTYPYEVHFWDSYDGFTLYSTIDRDFLYTLPNEERWDLDGQRVLVKVKFDFKSDVPTLSISFSIGGDKEIEGHVIDTAVFDLPKEVNKEEMQVWLDDLLNDQIRTVVENFKFPVPPKNTEDED